MTTSSKHHTIDYIELTVTDLAAAKAFYQGAFGWAFNDYGPSYAGIRGEGNTEVGGLFDHLRALCEGGTAIVLITHRLASAQTADCIHFLRAGRIAGAGLDVFEREPLSPDSPLLRLPNVVATPHIGSATEETREAMARCAVDNLLAALAGERPLNLVNPSAWARRRGA